MAERRFAEHIEEAFATFAKELVMYFQGVDYSTSNTGTIEDEVILSIRTFYSGILESRSKQSYSDLSYSDLDPNTFTVLSRAHSMFCSKLSSVQKLPDENGNLESMVKACSDAPSLLGVSPTCIEMVIGHEKTFKGLNRKRKVESPIVRSAKYLLQKNPKKFEEVCEVICREQPELRATVFGGRGSKLGVLETSGLRTKAEEELKD